MLLGLYYLAVALVLIAASPFLLLKKKCRSGLASKLGFIPEKLQHYRHKLKPRIWFHAVSVGEFNAALPLIKACKQSYPDFEIFVSTTTATGQAQALSALAETATVFYFPLDLPFATGAWLDLIQPDAVVIVETEIWPGFLNKLKASGIPSLFVNARMSPRSFASYKRYAFFFQPVLKCFNAICVQNALEAEHFKQLGYPDDRLYICGNIKFDGLSAIDTGEKKKLQKQLGLAGNETVVIGGSTHPKEEEAILQCWQAEQKSFKLILVPRHPERFDTVDRLIGASGGRTRRFSRKEKFEEPADVILVDTIGVLSRLYALASLAFVGGTIAKVGGHNLVEPCIYRVPVLCGPHVFKTRDTARSLVQAGALAICANTTEVKKRLAFLLHSPPERQAMGEAGFGWIKDNHGATQKCLSVIADCLPEITHSQTGTGSIIHEPA